MLTYPRTYALDLCYVEQLRVCVKPRKWVIFLKGGLRESLDEGTQSPANTIASETLVPSSDSFIHPSQRNHRNEAAISETKLQEISEQTVKKTVTISEQSQLVDVLDPLVGACQDFLLHCLCLTQVIVL